MDKSNFDLEYFTDLYVDTALKIAKEPISLDKFDRDIRKNISEKLNISVQDLGWLHQPFHWAFFLKKNDSPFELQGDYMVRLKKKVYPETKSKMVDYILTNSRSLLEEKIKANL